MRRAYRVASEVAMVSLGAYWLWWGIWSLAAMAFGMAALFALGAERR